MAGAGADATGGMQADELLRLDNQLCFPLYACSKEVVRRYAPFLDPLGLTYTQYICMMVLWEEGQVSVSHLGERVYLDSGTLTPLLRKLEQKGYVRRERSSEDARQVLVSLTPEGRQLKERAAKVPLQIVDCFDLSPEDARQLKRLLLKVLRNERKS
ncbi:MAG: MarR family transcriptional regulator [Coriobacteriales bacterium]|nr:MarR family transcriptional regulator [Coriobacteriales bacterium]